MGENIIKTYESLINIKVRRGKFIFLSILIVLSMIIVSYFIKGFDTYNTYGVSDGQDIYIDIPIRYSKAVKNNSYIKIDGKKDNLSVLDISQLQQMGQINYQTYHIDVKESFEVNEVVEVTFYYNKQRIIKKIIKLIF